MPTSPAATLLLSPRDLARIIGVGESSMKRWIDDGRLTAVRTVGGHRRITTDDALRFIRANGHPIIDPRPLGLAPLAKDGRDLGEQLHEQLMQGRALVVRTLLFNAWMAGTSLAALVDGPIRSAMARIGELWAHDRNGIAIEHQATDAILQALSSFRVLLGEPAADAPLALGGSPPKDPYLIPSLGVALAFQEIGWRTANLGPETPVDSLLSAAERQQPRIVWLACSTKEGVTGLRPALHRLADQLAPSGTHLLIGGRVSGELRLERRPNLLPVGSLAEAVAFARGLWQPTR